MGVLDQDLPASIKPATVMPTSFQTKLPTYVSHIPVVFYNQFGRFHASVTQANASSAWNSTFGMYATGDAHYHAEAYPYGDASELPNEPWSAFYSRVIIGDSGGRWEVSCYILKEQMSSALYGKGKRSLPRLPLVPPALGCR